MDDEEGRSSLISHLYKESSKRQQRIIQRIKVENYVLQELLHLPLFVAGSRADGSNDSSSDVDLNYLVQNFLVMRDGDKIIASTDKDILILRQGNCYPGYCKLEFSSGTPSDVPRILTYQAHTNKKTVADGFLSDSDFLAKARELVPVLFKNFGGSLRNLKNIHGPCVTPTHTIGKDEGTEMDLAFCIQCDHWPDMANEWLDRYRPHGWPGVDLIQRIRNYKCWFVPIGFSEEQEKRDVEWRVSFTIAERDLMWSLQPTQLLCVEFLKSFVSHKLEHKFPNLLCSYFLKTIMFWLFEESPVSFWQSQNLIECMKVSINKLIQSLVSRECPHYFIRNNNLFVKKHGDSLSEAGHLITSMDIDTEISDFIDRKSHFYKKNCIFQSHIMVNTVAICRHFIHGFFETHSLLGTTAFPGEFSTDIHGMDAMIIHQLKNTIASSFGSMLLSKSSDNYQRANVYMEEAKESDVFAGTLKHATALFSIGKTDQVLQILSALTDQDFSRIVHYSFYERSFQQEPDDSLYPYIDDVTLQEVMAKYISLDVIWLPSEINIVPNFIKFELVDRKPLFMAPILYTFCLEFSCHMRRHNLDGMCQTFNKYCSSKTLFLKGGSPRYDTDMKGYISMVLGDYKQAWKFLTDSYLSKEISEVPLWIVSTLLNKYFKTTK